MITPPQPKKVTFAQWILGVVIVTLAAILFHTAIAWVDKRIQKTAVNAVSTASLPIVGEIRAFAIAGPHADSYMQDLRQAGWVECAGQAFNRNTVTEKLFDKLAHAMNPWGTKGGSILLPDLRGMFLRGWNHNRKEDGDPDVSQRLVPEGGSGFLDSVGTSQKSAFLNHTHGQQISGAEIQGKMDGIAGTNNGSLNGDGNPSRLHTKEADSGASSHETRPANVYVLYCIYVGSAPVTEADIGYGSIHEQ
jgi:hypothetical protein